MDSLLSNYAPIVEGTCVPDKRDYATQMHPQDPSELLYWTPR